MILQRSGEISVRSTGLFTWAGGFQAMSAKLAAIDAEILRVEKELEAELNGIVTIINKVKTAVTPGSSNKPSAAQAAASDARIKIDMFKDKVLLVAVQNKLVEGEYADAAKFQIVADSPNVPARVYSFTANSATVYIMFYIISKDGLAFSAVRMHGSNVSLAEAWTKKVPFTPNNLAAAVGALQAMVNALW